MSEGAWESRIREIFDEALELDAGMREAFLAVACGGDALLEHEVRELLAADEAAGGEEFWQRSALHAQVGEGSWEESAVGEVVGQYRLVELIGKGGMGSVYRAVRVDAEFDKCVAVKLLNEAVSPAQVVAHFRAERQILANLEHPNIARLLDGGARADGMPYLILEYVEGIAPREYCEGKKLSIAERLVLFRQICAAVHYAHQNMVIHRDLKPGNILVTADGVPKLLDFGIAKVLTPAPPTAGGALTEPGMLKMTVRYASPEQVRGEAVTTASDVYSLGVVLYELLTGHSPYGDGERPMHQLMAAVCEEEPVRPSVWDKRLRGDLDRILLRALGKGAGERYASVDQLSEDLWRYLEGWPVEARGYAPLYLATKFVRRNRVAVLAGVLVLASLVTGLVEVTLARRRADRRFNQVRQLAHSVLFDYADAIDRLPGATPVRARLVTDALTYLDNLSQEADTPELKREIVDAYVRVSNVQGNEYQNNLGDTAGALGSARKAVAAAEALLRQDRSAAALGSAADAFSTYGDLLYSAGELPAVKAPYERAVALRQEIAGKEPRDLDNRLALMVCFRHLGDLTGGTGFESLGRTADALAVYEQGRERVEGLIREFPGNVLVTKESYKTLISVGTAEVAMGRLEAAAGDLREAVARIEAVRATQPNDANAQVELAIAEVRLGQVMLNTGDGAGAMAHIARSVEILKKLLVADAGNALYRRNQAVAEAAWGMALSETAEKAGEKAEAVAHEARALELAEALSHDAPGSSQYRSDVGNMQRGLANVLLEAGKAEEALKPAEAAEETLCLSHADGADAYSLANCGRALLAVGRVQLARQKGDAAVLALKEAERIAAERVQADGANAVLRSDWANAEAALGRALVASGNAAGGRDAMESALKNWGMLREGHSLTVADAQQVEEVTKALAEVRSRRRG